MNTDFDTALHKALTVYNRALVKSFPEETESAADFSPRHQRRMEKLFKCCDRFYYPAVRTKSRRALALAATVTLVLALPLSVGAVRESFTQFVTEVYTVCTDLFFPSSAPSAPFVPTEPSYIPAGFKEVSRESDKTSCYILYKNESNSEIWIKQTAEKNYSLSLDTEQAQVEKIILDNNVEAMYTCKNNLSQLVFYYNNTVYHIGAYSSQEETVRIANSLLQN